MILRDYQTRAVAELRAQYSAGRRSPVCVAPTGSGKAVIAAEVIRLSLQRNLRALLLVPRIELLNQAVRKLDDAGVKDIRVIQASRDEGNPGAPVVAASIPTLVTEKWLAQLPPADLVLVDECHHGRARTHQDLLSRYPAAKLLGFTATPERGDSKALGDVYDSIVVVATVRELTDLKHLVPCKVLAPPRIMSTRELAQDPTDAYEQKTPGQKAIVFCNTVEHARKTAEAFTARGHSTKWICGESRDREDVIDMFARDEFRVLVNVSCLVEGFDDPAISVAILAKRFTHVGSYLQALGRILRTYPGKFEATAIDLCGSALVHGTPDLEREYSLSGKGIGSTRQPIRQCQACGAVFVSAAAQACIYCAFKLPPLTRAQMKTLGLKLEEVGSQTRPTSWPMRAKRRGLCSGCHAFIEQGAWIVYSSQSKQAMHAACASKAARKVAA